MENFKDMRKTLLAALMLMQMSAWAKVDLPEILSDNMVLQQQTEVKLWGKAKANAEVNIGPSWTNSIYTVKTDSDGKWIAEIQTPSASYTPGKLYSIYNYSFGRRCHNLE